MSIIQTRTILRIVHRNKGILLHGASYDRVRLIIFFYILSRMVSFKLKPLSTKGDQHEISPYNVNALSGKMTLVDISTNSLHFFY